MGGAGWREVRGAGAGVRGPNTAETKQTPARPESHNDLTVGRAARSFRRKLGATRNPSEQLLSCARGGAGEALTIDLLAAQSA